MQNPQDEILIGEAYYFDVVGRQIVAKGFGQFDPANYHLKAELSTTAPGTYNKLFNRHKNSLTIRNAFCILPQTA